MFIDAGQVATDYDLVVVGGGAVGLTVAVDSADRGARVLLLEAGPARSAEHGADRFRSVVDGQPFRGTTDGRARVLGGTTTRWGGQFLPLPASVFDARPWLHAPAWPVTAAELTPFYDEAARLFGLPAARPRAPWTKDTPGSPVTDDLRVEFSQWTSTPNFAARFATQLATHPLVHVLTDVQVVDLETEGGAVDGFAALTASGSARFSVRGAYVLAAGTIESVRLLHSAPGLAGAIEPAARAHVGARFHDHVALVAARVVVRDRRKFHRFFDGYVLDGVKVTAKLALDPAATSSEELLEVGGFFAMGEGGEGPRALRAALQHLRRRHGPAAVVRELWTAVKHGPSVLGLAWHYLARRRIAGDRRADVWLHLHAEQEVHDESRIEVEAGDDGQEPGPAVVHWKVSDASRRAMARLAAEIDEALRGSGLGHLEVVPTLASEDEYVHSVHDSLHHMGGLVMSPTAATGVCDGYGRVWGVDNLYVAGAALFPSGGYSNPTHTALALALRLSRRLSGPHSGPEVRA